MPIYEMRTYTLQVGKMGEATKLYTELGYPALKAAKLDANLVGFFLSDTGAINQILHIWRFADDAARRQHWAAVYQNADFMEKFVGRIRALIVSQEVKLLLGAPWGPRP